MNIALIAHDNLKPAMIEWCKTNKHILEKHFLVGTGTTASLISEATGLPVRGFNSGPLGGDQQIGARIVEGIRCLHILMIRMSKLCCVSHRCLIFPLPTMRRRQIF